MLVESTKDTEQPMSCTTDLRAPRTPVAQTSPWQAPSVCCNAKLSCWKGVVCEFESNLLVGFKHHRLLFLQAASTNWTSRARPFRCWVGSLFFGFFVVRMFPGHGQVKLNTQSKTNDHAAGGTWPA